MKRTHAERLLFKITGGRFTARDVAEVEDLIADVRARERALVLNAARRAFVDMKKHLGFCAVVTCSDGAIEGETRCHRHAEAQRRYNRTNLSKKGVRRGA